MNAIAQLQPKNNGSPDPALLAAVVQAFPESLAIVKSGLIVYANPAWRGLFECHDSQSLGEPVKHWLRQEDEIGVEANFVHSRNDGTRLHIEARQMGFRARGADFRLIHARDVSGQKQMERQLHEAESFEAVGRLVGGVAHDFNNLLTGIILYCDLLMGELAKDSRPHRHVQEMRQAGELGAALVQQLLAVARPAAERPLVFALNHVVTGTLDLLRRLIGENIVLTTELAADLGATRMDPSQVQQILLNLVLNARDAMPDGGHITLRTRNFSDSSFGSGVELSVADTGGGMDAETLERAFEPFFTTKKPGRGNGLGLATARRLARQEGGTIIAESEPGNGTRVCVRLPRVQAGTPSNSKEKVMS
jgi:two-component system, cell cycle sensor histidine kinase and response regulator CckA